MSVVLFLPFFPSHLLSSPYSSSSPFRNSDPGSHASTPPTSPLQCVPSISIARRAQQFVPSSTRVELCVHSVGLKLAKSALAVTRLNHQSTGGGAVRAYLKAAKSWHPFLVPLRHCGANVILKANKRCCGIVHLQHCGANGNGK